MPQGACPVGITAASLGCGGSFAEAAAANTTPSRTTAGARTPLLQRVVRHGSPYDRTVIDRGAIEQARDVIRGRLHRTPTLTCRTLGADVYLKAELFQKTGSFKPRGMLNVVASLSDEEKAGGI